MIHEPGDDQCVRRCSGELVQPGGRLRAGPLQEDLRRIVGDTRAGTAPLTGMLTLRRTTEPERAGRAREPAPRLGGADAGAATAGALHNDRPCGLTKTPRRRDRRWPCKATQRVGAAGACACAGSRVCLCGALVIPCWSPHRRASKRSLIRRPQSGPNPSPASTKAGLALGTAETSSSQARTRRLRPADGSRWNGSLRPRCRDLCRRTACTCATGFV